VGEAERRFVSFFGFEGLFGRLWLAVFFGAASLCVDFFFAVLLVPQGKRFYVVDFCCCYCRLSILQWRCYQKRGDIYKDSSGDFNEGLCSDVRVVFFRWVEEFRDGGVRFEVFSVGCAKNRGGKGSEASIGEVQCCERTCIGDTFQGTCQGGLGVQVDVLDFHVGINWQEGEKADFG